MVGGRCLALRRGDEWVFPKGHLAPGERPEDAAVREVREETGLEVRIIASIGSTRYEFGTPDGAGHRKRVQWFLAESSGHAVRLEPPFSEAAFLDQEEIGRVLTHQADRELAGRAFDAVGLAKRGAVAPTRWPDSTLDGEPSDPGPFPDVIDIVTEIPRSSRTRYVWDEHVGALRLERVLSSPVVHGFDGAAVSQTRSAQGARTPALLLVDEPVFPGCHVWARPIGGLELSAETGATFVVLCVALEDPAYRHVSRLADVEQHHLRDIEGFCTAEFRVSGRRAQLVGWRDVDRAHEVLVDDRARCLHESAEGASDEGRERPDQPPARRRQAPSPAAAAGAASGTPSKIRRYTSSP
jgi:inorganic pyrophosphatase